MGKCEIRIPGGEGAVLYDPSAEQVAAMWDHLRTKWDAEPVVVFDRALGSTEVKELNAVLQQRLP
jgi:hypothetical protein